MVERLVHELQRRNFDAPLAHHTGKPLDAASRGAKAVTGPDAIAPRMPQQLAVPFEVFAFQAGVHDLVGVPLEPRDVVRNLSPARRVPHGARHDERLALRRAHENLICRKDHVFEIFDRIQHLDAQSRILERRSQRLPLAHGTVVIDDRPSHKRVLDVAHREVLGRAHQYGTIVHELYCVALKSMMSGLALSTSPTPGLRINDNRWPAITMT